MRWKKLITCLTMTLIAAPFLAWAGGDLNIASGSENKSLRSIVDTFNKNNNTNVKLTFSGSLDIYKALADKGSKLEYDAVWPASWTWIELGDVHSVLKHTASIWEMPVVPAIRLSMAKSIEIKSSVWNRPRQ